MFPFRTRLTLESLEDRAVPAAVGPVPAADPSANVPAQAAAVPPPTTTDPALTPVVVTPSPTQPANGAVSSTPAQNPGQVLLLTPLDQATVSNTREPTPGTSKNVEDVQRVARSNVEQGLRDAVGGMPTRRITQMRPTFGGTDQALDEASLFSAK